MIDSFRGYRLDRLEIRNFGGYHLRTTAFQFHTKGAIFSGENGAGKSTAIDAYRMLYRANPTFNSATQQNGRNDRNVATYYLGQYGNKDNGNGRTTGQRLRVAGDKNGFMAICGVFRDAEGGVFSALRMGYMNNQQTMEWRCVTAHADISVDRHFPDWGTQGETARRAEDLGGTLHGTLADFFAAIGNAFGIESRKDTEEAFRFVDESIGVKKLESITDFARKHVFPAESLEEGSNTFVKTHLLAEESRLKLVAIENKIADLLVIQRCFAAHERAESQLLGAWNRQHRFEQFGHGVQAVQYQRAIARQRRKRDGDFAKAQESERARDAAQMRLDGIAAQLMGQGAQRVADLKTQRMAAEAERGRAEKRLEGFFLNLNQPIRALRDSDDLSALRGKADAARDGAEQSIAEHDRAHRALIETAAEAKARLNKASDVLQSISTHRTAIDARALAARAGLAQSLGLRAEDLPFFAEMIRIKPQETAWEGAANRALGAVGMEILVPLHAEQDAARALNARHWGTKIVLRMTSLLPRDARPADPRSLAAKMDVLDGTPYESAVRIILADKARHLCLDEAAFAHSKDWAVTQNGAVRQGSTVQKDDRSAIGDRSKWILGWGIEGKIADAEAHVAAAKAAHDRAEGQIRESQDGQKILHGRFRGIQNALENWPAFADVDVAGPTARREELDAAIAQIDTPELRSLSEQQDQARSDVSAATADAAQHNAEAHKTSGRIDNLLKFREESLKQRRDEAQKHGAMTREERKTYLKAVSKAAQGQSVLAYLGTIENGMQSAIGQWRQGFQDGNRADQDVGRRESDARNEAKAYLAKHPEDAPYLLSDVVPSERSEKERQNPRYKRIRDEWMAFLDKNVKQDLPRHKAEIAKASAEYRVGAIQSLSAQVHSYESTIRAMEKGINAILTGVVYDPGKGSKARLRMVEQREEPAIAAFKRNLSAAIGLIYEQGEAFDRAADAILKDFLDKDSHEGRRKHALITNLANWYEMSVEEYTVDAHGLSQQERVYAGRDGVSGGQGERLTMLLLGAGMSYVFGAYDASRPRTGLQTIVLDEAFMHGSDDTAEAATDLLTAMGLQMIAATPSSKLLSFSGNTDRVFEIVKTNEQTQSIPSSYAHLLDLAKTYAEEQDALFAEEGQGA